MDPICTTLNRELSLLLLPDRFFEPSNWEPLKAKIKILIHSGTPMQIGSPLESTPLSDSQKIYLITCMNRIMEQMLAKLNQELYVMKRDFENAAKFRDISARLNKPVHYDAFIPELPAFTKPKDVIILQTTGNSFIDDYIYSKLELI